MSIISYIRTTGICLKNKRAIRFAMMTVKWLLDVALVVILAAIISVLIKGGYRLDVGPVQIGLMNFRRLCLFLAIVFSLRYLLGDKFFNDRFSRLSMDIAKNRFFPIFMFIILAVVFVAAKVHYHLAFRDPALDFSIYEYALFNTLKSAFMYTPFLHKCFLGEHFSPVLLTALPFYAILPSAYTLISWQAILLAATFIPGYYLAKSVWNDGLCAAVFALGLTTMSAFGTILQCDLHPEAVYPPLILLTVLALEKKRPGMFLFALFALLTVKEDAAVYAVVLSIGAICYRRWWRIGLLGILVSLAAWFLVIYVLMPACGSEGYGPTNLLISRWGQYGDSYWQIVVWFFTHPLQLAVILANPGILKLLLFFFCAPLLSPWVLIIIPQWIMNSTSASVLQNEFAYYTGAPIAALFAVAAVYGIRNLSRWLSRHKFNGKLVMTVFTLGIMVVNFGHLNLVKNDPGIGDAYRILSLIPKDASLATSEYVIPHVPPREEIFMLPEGYGAEYVFIDTGLGGRFSRVDAMRFVTKLSIDADYMLMDKSPDERFYLFKRVDSQ